MIDFKHLATFGGVVGVLVVLGATAWHIGDRQVKKVWHNHIATELVELKNDAAMAAGKISTIYSGIRTIALLPSVRNVNRDADNLTDDSRANIQQIYNNLKAQLNVSEIYVLPADFNPKRIDPRTGKLQSPIASFDELIVQGGKFALHDNPFEAVKSTSKYEGELEVEDEEYIVMVEQIAHFARLGALRPDTRGLNTPLLTSKEIITCDNTVYENTRIDADRKGFVFSVPFYGKDDSFRGMISAVVRTNVVAGFSDIKGSVIIGPNGVVGNSLISATAISHDSFEPSLRHDNAEQMLQAHEVIKTPDIAGNWELRFDHRANEFYDSADFREIRNLTVWILISLVVAACSAVALAYVNMRRNAKLKYAATHDALTSLPNRPHIEECIRRMIADRKPDAKNLQALFYLDLDKFKLVNDTMGHQAGDEVLVHAANLLLECVRINDIVARIGGDEFVILVSGMKSFDQIIALAKRINSEMRVPIKVGRRTAHIGTSIGIAMVDDQVVSAEALLRQADLALFRAKAEERGNFRFYAPEMDIERERRRELEADLKNGLTKDQFVLHYQPIYSAATSEITGYEALVRWQHPVRGMIPPLQFIELAEETGFINELGEWILKQACTDAMKFGDAVRMAVNLSPVQFRNTTLPLRILAILNQTGLSPQRLELEITEGVLLADDVSTIAMLNQLRAIGVRIALDDFGTGYSSLGYLKSFEFDKVKIDRSFLKDIDKDKEAIVLKAVTQLSNSLGMSTVAEGVETVEQLIHVREQGCTEVQGFYFSKPKPISDIIKAQNRSKSSA